MNYLKQFLCFVLVTGFISGLILLSSGFNPLYILILVLLAIIPALLIPNFLITGFSRGVL